MDNKAYAQEYITLMNQLNVCVAKFRGYNGSKEHLEKLEEFIENGQKFYLERGILSEKDVKKCFGIAKTQIINRQKTKSLITYLEKCIEEEKKNLQSLDVEKKTMNVMCQIMEIYLNAESCTDEKWEEIINFSTENYDSLINDFANNSFSNALRHESIKEAIMAAMYSIEDNEKIERRNQKEA